MKKFIPIILCVLLVFTLGMNMTGCSSSAVTVTVADQYENELADKLADSKTIDEDGNTVYTFSKPKYIDYLKQLMKKVESEYRKVIAETATYSYLNEDGTELVIGIENGLFDEGKCKEQAQQIGEIALLYNVSTLEHTGTVSVTYENCFTGEKLFKSDITAIERVTKAH